MAEKENYQNDSIQYARKMAKASVDSKQFRDEIKQNNGMHPLTETFLQKYPATDIK